MLGFRAVQALRAARIFKQHDEATMRDLVQFVDDEKNYVSRARQHIENLETALQNDKKRLTRHKDDAWEIGVEKNNV
jgi:glutathione-regulated potassium-efflux system ancillary protein KefC